MLELMVEVGPAIPNRSSIKSLELFDRTGTNSPHIPQLSLSLPLTDRIWSPFYLILGRIKTAARRPRPGSARSVCR